jgi:hypothetical protein
MNESQCSFVQDSTEAKHVKLKSNIPGLNEADIPELSQENSRP